MTSQNASSAIQTSRPIDIPSVKIGEGDEGKTIAINKGQAIRVQLPANPSTGYQWYPTVIDRSLGYPTTDEFHSGTLMPGSGGVQTLSWDTNNHPFVGQGSRHDIRLEYRRLWETAPVREFFVRVVVNG